MISSWDSLLFCIQKGDLLLAKGHLLKSTQNLPFLSSSSSQPLCCSLASQPSAICHLLLHSQPASRSMRSRILAHSHIQSVKERSIGKCTFSRQDIFAPSLSVTINKTCTCMRKVREWEKRERRKSNTKERERKRAIGERERGESESGREWEREKEREREQLKERYEEVCLCESSRERKKGTIKISFFTSIILFFRASMRW
jgi:hypothetical protein